MIGFPQKILVTLDFPPAHGGIQRFLHDLVVHTYAQTDMVLVGAGAETKQTPGTYPCPIIYVSSVLSTYDEKFSIFPLCIKLIRLLTADSGNATILCGNIFAACAAFPLKMVFGKSYSVYVYGTELLPLRNKLSIKALFLRSVLSHAETIISISDYTTELVKKILPNATVQKQTPKISLEKYPFAKDEMQARSVKNENAFKILSVGRLVKHKGHDCLIKAVSDLPKAINWNLVIVGSGPQLNSLKLLAAKYNIQNKVEFRTDLSDEEVCNTYRESSIFVFPSVSNGGTEGFGIVLLEAMAHFLPIIASDTGAVREVLDNGKCGMLIPPGDSGFLCKAICRLFQEPELRHFYATAANQRVIENYAW